MAAVLYVTIQDMRDEGVTTAMADDTFLSKRIELASRFIEAATRRFFYPKELTVKVDGRGGPMLLFSDPIISVAEVKFEVSPLFPSDFILMSGDIFRIYNRHLTQGLLEPDDRNNPKIELFNPAYVRELSTRLVTPLNFPRGQQNIQVEGVFGYTDPDPAGTNAQGVTPFLIKHVCKLIVMRELAKIGKISARFDATVRHRLTSERTRDQAYTLSPLGSQLTGALFTGDPAIDNLLSYYSRPPALGAV